MSTDPVPARRAGRAPISPFVAIVAILGLLCVGLVVLTIGQGPRLISAQVDTDNVVKLPNQRAVLTSNRILAEITPAQVTVTPAAPFSLITRDDALTIVFPERLRFSTDYEISVKDVKGVGTEAAGSFSYGFTTSETAFYYLQRGAVRGPDEPDRILRSTLSAPGDAVIFEAPHISHFVIDDDSVVAVTTLPDGSSGLHYIDLARALDQPLSLPMVGTILDLRVGASSMAFLFSSNEFGPDREYQSTLFTYAFGTSNLATAVLGLDGAPLQVLDYRFVPGKEAIVAQLFDTGLQLIDLTGAQPPLPLGSFSSIDDISDDATTLIATTSTGRVMVDLATGQRSDLAEPTISTDRIYVGKTLFAPGSAADLISQVTVVDDSGASEQHIVETDSAGSRIVYTVPAGGQISGFTITPNGQYIGVEIVPNIQTQVSDLAPLFPRATSTTTYFVDRVTGTANRGVVGFGSAWG